jgi:hypothetical protein
MTGHAMEECGRPLSDAPNRAGRASPESTAAQPRRQPVDVVVSRSPQHSIFSQVSAAARARRVDLSGLGLTGEQAFAVRALGGSLAAGYVPDVSVPIADRPDVSVAEQVDALHDRTEADVAADFAYVAERSRGWAAAADQPRRWLRGYAELTRSGWRRFEPRWRSSRELLDRETEAGRLGRAGPPSDDGTSTRPAGSLTSP